MPSIWKRVWFAVIAGSVPTAIGLALLAYESFTQDDRGAWFQLPPGRLFLITAAIILMMDCAALLLTLPLIALARKLSGWWLVLWAAAGTLYLPVVGACILSRTRAPKPLFDAESLPIFAVLGVGSMLATGIYLLLVKRASRTRDVRGMSRV